MKGIKITAISLLFAITVVAGMYFLTEHKPKENWTISGGEADGNYDAVGAALGDILNKKNGWQVEIINSSGSLQNLELLSKKQADLALVQNDVVGDEDIHSIATLYEEALHVIVRDDISSLAELAGRSISIGPKGGGTGVLVLTTLKKLGLEAKDATWRRESLKSGLQALREKKTDAVCIVTGVGNATIEKFLKIGGFKILTLGTDITRTINYVYPFVHPTVIPAGAYPYAPGRGLPENNIPTIGTKVILACRSDLTDEDAYQLTRFLNENKASLVRTNPLFAQMDSPQGLDYLQFPTHEGSRLYYEKDKPHFFQEWSEPIALILTVLGVAWASALAIREIYQIRRRDRLDDFFQKLEFIIAELLSGPDKNRTVEIASELHEIRKQTTHKLVSDQLSADNSFVIFQRQLHTAQQLVNERLRRLR
jgi:TRAP transporter TAXI family solute receptor